MGLDTDDYGQDGTIPLASSDDGWDEQIPLVASIPELQNGVYAPGTAVILRSVAITSPMRIDVPIFYIQDPTVSRYAGLSVSTVGLPTSAELPQPLTWLELYGTIQHDDANGWLLDLSGFSTETSTTEVGPLPVTAAELTDDSVSSFNDMLLDVDPTNLTVVTTDPEQRLFVVRGSIIVDLRPFAVDIPIPEVGAQVEVLVGIADTRGPRPVIMPRSAADLGLQ